MLLQTEIIALLRKYLSNTISTEELDELRKSVDFYSPDELETILNEEWDLMSNVRPIDPILKQKILSKIYNRTHLSIFQKMRRYKLQIASSIIIVFLTGLLVYFYYDNHQMSEKGKRNIEVKVERGESSSITLPDGTHVKLNSESVLTYEQNFGINDREVKLIGEGLFDVAKDKTKPFIVLTGKMNIKALGTKFNVFNYPQHPLKVSLLEGSIRVYDPRCECGLEYLLKPNQQITEKNGRYVISGIGNNPIIWVKGLYAFNQEKLSSVFDKLELYYGVKIIVKRSELLDDEFTGKFRKHDGILEVLSLIRKVYPFKMKEDEESDTITIE